MSAMPADHAAAVADAEHSPGDPDTLAYRRLMGLDRPAAERAQESRDLAKDLQKQTYRINRLE